MKNLGALPIFVRAGGLAVAVVLFVIGLLSDTAWDELCGFGLAIVALVMLSDSLRHRRGAGAIIKMAALAAAAVFFVLAAIVDSGNVLDMLALGFAFFALSVIADHLADFAAVRAAIAAAADHGEAAAPAAAAAAPAARPPAPAPAAPAPAASATAGKCAKCGEPLKADERFCTACGTARA